MGQVPEGLVQFRDRRKEVIEMNYPMIIDFVLGVHGAFIDVVDDPDNIGTKVFPIYKPINGLTKKRYPISLDKDSISDPIAIGGNGVPGVPKFVVVFMNDGTDRKTVMDKIQFSIGRKMQELLKQKNEERYARQIYERESRLKEKEEERRREKQYKTNLVGRLSSEERTKAAYMDDYVGDV